VTQIHGSETNVIGLPLDETVELLDEAATDLGEAVDLYDGTADTPGETVGPLDETGETESGSSD